MFGIRFFKVEPTDFVLQFKGGKAVREGVGLSFFYFAPTTSLVLIPVGSVDVYFIFEEVTADFQQVTVQGQITYRVADPRKLSQLMNFTLAANGKGYATDDPQKLPQRLINHTQVLTRASLKSLSLREALGLSGDLVASLRQGLQSAEAIASLGIEVLGLSILAIKPTPETARALEAETREQLLREADEAVYPRRNAAVEQERAIKENELNTEIAVENKKRQIKRNADGGGKVRAGEEARAARGGDGGQDRPRGEEQGAGRPRRRKRAGRGRRQRLWRRGADEGARRRPTRRSSRRSPAPA